MNLSYVLIIEATGEVRGLYTELIDLRALGTLTIKRATSIEFDHAYQCWRVFDQRSRCIYCSPSRETCLRWEQEYFTRSGNP